MFWGFEVFRGFRAVRVFSSGTLSVGVQRGGTCLGTTAAYILTSIRRLYSYPFMAGYQDGLLGLRNPAKGFLRGCRVE